ncbi:MAG TPA: phospholipase D-like domain-containing protein, partial [Chthonomonadaceae bacterium]|nr:phospholipase D-like domain-containing protein [Chthonomonadaceae bacterium]
MSTTQLLIQPGAGVEALIEGINQAKEYIHIVIFRFDRGDIEMALKRAARRGVFVHALVAYTSSGQGGEKMLRNLEMRLLADGITVTRTATDLVRYHDKLMIIDGKMLYMLGFNYTYLDIERSRCFGILSEDEVWIQEAERLFHADTTRQNYLPECDQFIVSPGNARKQLHAMLSAAQKQLLIYDGKLSDPEMMRLLAAKVRAGVEVRVIGATGKRAVGVKVVKPPMRLHAQVIVRDGEQLFLGSQSLRSLELDVRREVGLIVDDPVIAQQVVQTFEEDWEKGSAQKSTKLPLESTELEWETDLDVPRLSPTISAHLVKSAVKEAIKDALLET